MKSAQESYFSRGLLRWNKEINRRSMPWKGEKDPYMIWISEIILQQTRVEQGLAYYNRFVKNYPTVKKLAAADESAVFKLWEGLGYYSRCKNLIATAKFISRELDGKFPDSYENILQLKGIGPYTAAAIASFAYNLPYAVTDGNVMRVLARYFGISTAIDSTAGKKYFSQLANKLLAINEPAQFNQAIMDFGATVCKPQSPLCSQCVLKKKCIAFIDGETDKYPVKESRLVKKQRWFYYIVAEYKGACYIRKRTQKDIWQNLHEFYLIEKDKAADVNNLLTMPGFFKEAAKKFKVIAVSEIFRQQLTHQTIHGCFIHIELNKKIHIEGFEICDKTKMRNLAFPRLITGYFEGSKGFR